MCYSRNGFKVLRTVQKGGSVVRRHNGAMIIADRTYRRPYFLVEEVHFTHPEYRFHKPQVKFPGGSNKDQIMEIKPLVTAVREAREETGLVLNPGVEPVLVYSNDDPLNLKFFYFACLYDFSGKIRTDWIMDGLDALSPPFWLGEEGMDRIYKTHRPASFAGLRQYYRNPSVLVG